MLIKWSQSAEDELLEILAWYIEQGGKDLAEKIAKQIWQATQRLKRFPFSAPAGFIAGIRELSLPQLPYIVVYEVTDTVYVLRIFHTSQLWPYR